MKFDKVDILTFVGSGLFIVAMYLLLNWFFDSFIAPDIQRTLTGLAKTLAEVR